MTLFTVVKGNPFQPNVVLCTELQNVRMGKSQVASKESFSNMMRIARKIQLQYRMNWQNEIYVFQEEIYKIYSAIFSC